MIRWLLLPAASALIACGLGCAPTSGVVRPDHPMLGGELGRDGVAAPSGLAVVFDDARPEDDDAARNARANIARIAGASVGKGPVVANGERFRMDCSGVARGIYAKAGHRLGFVTVDAAAGTRINDTRVLFELVKQTGSLRRRDPLPGDLVFFDDTYDQNRNGLRDDPLSHVGIVEKVEGDPGKESVVIVHRVGTNIVRARMTLGRPHERHDEGGKPLNHFLRSAHRGEPGKTTAQLFVAYGSLPLVEGAAQVAVK